MVDKLTDLGLIFRHLFDGSDRGFYQYGQPSGFVAVVLTVMHGLPGQPHTQVAATTLQNTQVTDDVMQHLVTATELVVIDH
jgi:hypothetical protein